MSAAAFDTLKLSRRLKTVGFSHKQATGMAEMLNDALDAELVTRAYLDSRLAETKAELKAEIAETKAELKAEIARLEGKIETESAAIQGQFGRLNWMLLLVVAAVALPWIERIAAPLINNSP